MSACVLIGMSSGTMATNSKEKVRVCGMPTCVHMCMFVCMSFFIQALLIVLHACICLCVNV